VNVEKDQLLFRGHDRVFKQLAASCDRYLEFGSGQSTIWMSYHTMAEVTSVETSPLHAVATRSAVGRSVDIEVLDLGLIADWGRPIDYSCRERFSHYQQFGYNRLNDNENNLVLIDGRFRVACTLNAFLLSPIGTYVIVDDYLYRPHYHCVSEFLEPTEMCGEQALFVVTDNVRSAPGLAEEALKFQYVME